MSVSTEQYNEAVQELNLDEYQHRHEVNGLTAEGGLDHTPLSE